MKWKNTGLTLIEILVVLGIIALLVGLLLPALTTVKNSAKEVKQKAQFSAINLALVTFKNDYGDYPPSGCPLGGNYTGAQQLAEALVGWDLLGFHPKSAWRADGLDANGGNKTYDPPKTRDADGDGVPDTLNERKGLYLDSETANAFTLGEVDKPGTGLFKDTTYDVRRNWALAPDTFVLCDVFNVKEIMLRNANKAMAGSPILYYKANTTRKLINGIYNALDNNPIVLLKNLADQVDQPLSRYTNAGNEPANYEFFYNYISDPKTFNTIPQPYRPDSFILISAGLDGIYGTSDDIRNFGN